MAVHHRTRPYPGHFDPQPCRRCKARTAEVYVEADRRSRSGNLCRYTVGAYCRPCARALIRLLHQQQPPPPEAC